MALSCFGVSLRAHSVCYCCLFLSVCCRHQRTGRPAGGERERLLLGAVPFFAEIVALPRKVREGGGGQRKSTVLMITHAVVMLSWTSLLPMSAPLRSCRDGEVVVAGSRLRFFFFSQGMNDTYRLISISSTTDVLQMYSSDEIRFLRFYVHYRTPNRWVILIY